MTLTRTTTTEPAPWDWTAVRSVCLKEARRVLGRISLAEDAAQEATVRAWRNRRSCHSPERPGPWIAAIARREAFRLATAASAARDSPLEPGAMPGAPSPETGVIDRVVLRQAIDALDAEDRALVLGRYWDDLSYAELADRFALPISTVGVRLHRVRLRLRGTLLSA